MSAVGVDAQARTSAVDDLEVVALPARTGLSTAPSPPMLMIAWARKQQAATTGPGVAKRKLASAVSGERSDRQLWAGASRPTGS
jgi:hypothetical protein